MKWLTQVGLPVLGVAVLVGGVTFVSHFYPARPPASSQPRDLIQVEDPADRDGLDLGRFATDTGTRKAIVLVSDDPGVELAIGGQSPDYLQVSLEPMPGPKGKRWRLLVQVPPGQAEGPLPSDSAVLVQVLGQTQRLRVPVRGNAQR